MTLTLRSLKSEPQGLSGDFKLAVCAIYRYCLQVNLIKINHLIKFRIPINDFH